MGKFQKCASVKGLIASTGSLADELDGIRPRKPIHSAVLSLRSILWRGCAETTASILSTLVRERNTADPASNKGLEVSTTEHAGFRKPIPSLQLRAVDWICSGRRRWASERAFRDVCYIVVTTLVAWTLIERAELCDAFFDWVEQNEETEVDSFILAGMLAAVGVLVFAIRRNADMRREVKERQAAEERVHALAFHDPLTGLSNRRALHDCLEGIVSHSHGSKKVGLLLLDLDRFKSVNDIQGHLAGDQLLRDVSARLVEMLPANGRAYRLGGDEFAIVVELAKGDYNAPHRVARRLVQAMSEPFEVSGRVHYIGASIGIAMFPRDARDRETLMRRADIALYRAKDSGRSCHRSFEAAMDAEITRRAVIESDLRLGLQRGEFLPFYQPVVDLRTGATLGFEMLARWQRTDEVVIAPDEFIPIAEESGLINELMLQLLERACEEARHWDPSLTIAINISPVQLKDPWLSHKVLSALTRFGFPTRRLAVEITENAIIADSQNAKRTIESLKNQGISIGLDDFGTGYSSLHHLRMLPFDKLKIDRSFIQGLSTDPEARKIVRAIITLATSLGLPVIAEGIEDEVIAQQLRQFGCAQGQGYHLGRPMSGDEITRTLGVAGSPRWRTTEMKLRKDFRPLSSAA